MSTAAPPTSPDAALRSVHTSNLPALFEQLQISLLVSTYQAGKVIVVRADGGRSIRTSAPSPNRWASPPTAPA